MQKFTITILSTLIISASFAYAQQDRGMQIVDDMSSKERIALVIGNGSYSSSPLANPVNDAQDRDSVNVPEGMVLVEGGTFLMGSDDGDDDEKPVHPVIVSDFYISKYEVTVAGFREFVDATGYRTSGEKGGGAHVLTGSKWEQKSDASWKNPYFSQADQNPVTCISLYDAVEYCNWRSRKENLKPCYTISGSNVSCNFSTNGYRLPTEAEWEFAARGGNRSIGYKYAGSNSPGDVAWYSSNSGSKTHPVGQKQANELGLYDMSGNIWEWCWDWYDEDYYNSSPSTDPKGASSGQYRVLRGGGWSGYDSVLRPAFRVGYIPVVRYDVIGFRLSKTH